MCIRDRDNSAGTGDSSGIIDEDWADESVYYGNTGQAEFPITIEDEWSGASANGGEQVIY